MITITENLTTFTISVTQGQTGTQDISRKVDDEIVVVCLQDYNLERNKTSYSIAGGTVDLKAHTLQLQVLI
jgi:hypothetical protein